MFGNCRRCYAIRRASRHREGRGKLYRFPRNPVRNVNKIIEHMCMATFYVPFNPFSVPNRIHKRYKCRNCPISNLWLLFNLHYTSVHTHSRYRYLNMENLCSLPYSLYFKVHVKKYRNTFGHGYQHFLLNRMFWWMSVVGT